MKPNGPIKLLLVDDHPIVRDGLQQLLRSAPSLQIVGEAATMQTAVKAAKRLAPDLILMDVRLPDGDGIEACRQIKALLPRTRVLFLTSYADNRFVLSSMAAGAEGYLLKESDGGRILSAIQTIMNGGTVFDPIVTRGFISEPRTSGANPLRALTGQERRVLAEVAKGKTDKEVAEALQLTPKTARNYVEHIYAKLNVHNRTEAALLFTRFSEQSRVWQ